MAVYCGPYLVHQGGANGGAGQQTRDDIYAVVLGGLKGAGRATACGIVLATWDNARQRACATSSVGIIRGGASEGSQNVPARLGRRKRETIVGVGKYRKRRLIKVALRQVPVL